MDVLATVPTAVGTLEVASNGDGVTYPGVVVDLRTPDGVLQRALRWNATSRMTGCTCGCGARAPKTRWSI